MPRGTTTERGLGHQHRQRRQRLLASLVEGTPCDVCGDGMYLDQQLDADHSTPRSRGGKVADRLRHSRCNRSEGSKLALAPKCDWHADCGSVHSQAW